MTTKANLPHSGRHGVEALLQQSTLGASVNDLAAVGVVGEVELNDLEKIISDILASIGSSYDGVVRADEEFVKGVILAAVCSDTAELATLVATTDVDLRSKSARVGVSIAFVV